MKKLNIIIIVLVLATFVLEGVNIFLSNRVSTDSIAASQLQQELARVEQENEILKTKVLEFASFESVASRAAEFGFVEPKDTLSLDAPVEVAKN